MRLFFPLCLVGCASAPSHSLEPGPSVAPAQAAPAAQVHAPALVQPEIAPARGPAPAADAPYGDDVRSVRFVTTTVLRKQPSSTSDKVGVIARDARARAEHAAPAGHGCATRWIAIAPRGWACETALAPSAEDPTPPRAASLDDEEPDDQPAVPGVYGVVRGKDVPAFASRADAQSGEHARVLTGATSVRARGVAHVDGRRYWITTAGELIDAASIATISPSTFRGIALDAGTTLPLAWTHAHGKPRAPVKIRATPSPDGEIIGELAPRTVVSIDEDAAGGAFVQVAEDGWVARADLRIARRTAPPSGTAADDRWFDVDLDEQVLVAYEGDRPVYATLVSTGKVAHRTPTSIARVVSKLASATMVSEKRERYSVADVPWTMYYDHDFALHTAYWHDGFGDPRSHGCVNLAPRDARVLYQWSSPDVPAGWIAVYGDADAPGSLVRVRSRDVPDPAFRGYARTLQERATLTASE
jgi:L,D-transpeptidase catalytic domain